MVTGPLWGNRTMGTLPVLSQMGYNRLSRLGLASQLPCQLSAEPDHRGAAWKPNAPYFLRGHDSAFVGQAGLAAPQLMQNPTLQKGR